MNDGFLKELGMAFVSVGQKYGFVSAGDLARKREAEALEKGRAEGETLGEQNKAREIAKNMRDMGVDISIIKKATKLPEKEIREL